MIFECNNMFYGMTFISLTHIPFINTCVYIYEMKVITEIN